MPQEMSDELKARVKEMFKAKQEQEDAQIRANIEDAIKNNTPFVELVRSEYDPFTGMTRHGVVYSKDGEQKVFFKGETPDDGFVVVLIPYRG